MSVAVISLIVLLAIIIISCFFTRLNPGLLALMAALYIGFFLSGMSINQIVDFFPTKLFVLLLSINLVFGVAQQNGTLEKLTQRAIFLIKGQGMLLPILIFIISFLLSALGPGNIAAVAVMAPVSMVLAKKHKISPLVIAIMLCTGANAGAFSPFSPTGVVALGLLEQINVNTKLIWVVFGASAVLQSFSALFAYLIFILRSKKRNSIKKSPIINGELKIEKMEKNHKLTIIVIFFLLIGVTIFKLPLTLMAVTSAVLMFVLNLGDEDQTLKNIPWNTINMVTGIAVLIGLMEKVGGLDLATTLIASSTGPDFINSALAFVSGLVSAYSSSSGVVLPAFIPLIPGLAEKMAISNIIPLVIAVAVGSHMVDVSPLSTLGALSISAVDHKETRDRMFKLLMIWGMSMSVVAGVLAFVFLDLFF